MKDYQKQIVTDIAISAGHEVGMGIDFDVFFNTYVDGEGREREVCAISPEFDTEQQDQDFANKVEAILNDLGIVTRRVGFNETVELYTHRPVPKDNMGMYHRMRFFAWEEKAIEFANRKRDNNYYMYGQYGQGVAWTSFVHKKCPEGIEVECRFFYHGESPQDFGPTQTEYLIITEEGIFRKDNRTKPVSLKLDNIKAAATIE